MVRVRLYSHQASEDVGRVEEEGKEGGHDTLLSDKQDDNQDT